VGRRNADSPSDHPIGDHPPVLFAWVIGSTPSGHAVFAPEWIDLAATLSLTPAVMGP